MNKLVLFSGVILAIMVLTANAQKKQGSLLDRICEKCKYCETDPDCNGCAKCNECTSRKQVQQFKFKRKKPKYNFSGGLQIL